MGIPALLEDFNLLLSIDEQLVHLDIVLCEYTAPCLVVLLVLELIDLTIDLLCLKKFALLDQHVSICYHLYSK